MAVPDRPDQDPAGYQVPATTPAGHYLPIWALVLAGWIILLGCLLGPLLLR